ncbi:MAG TPA: TadE family protein [Candidatus Limnocylindrales bacterium]|nr:TadE family protein [Candidatus Limnocylindrales bacterium]
MLRRLRARRPLGRGQGLVEFAIVLPVLALILLIVIDFGRLFYGWVNLQNAARIAANYAAVHPDDFPSNPQPAGYIAEVQRDTSGIDCDLASIPAPTFSDPNHSLGSTVSVTLTCDFHPLTPLISAFFNGTVTAGSGETFAVRSGILAVVPTPGPPGTPAPTAPPAPTPTPAATPTGGPTPTPTLAPGQCRVPTLIGVFTAAASQAWVDAGFNAQFFNVEIAPGHSDYKIGREYIGSTISVWDGSPQECATFSLNVGK